MSINKWGPGQQEIGLGAPRHVWRCVPENLHVSMCLCAYVWGLWAVEGSGGISR